MDFFLVSYFINNLHSFFTAQPQICWYGMRRVGGKFPDNSVFKRQNLLSFIIQPSKTKTTCQNHQNHQNHLSKSSKPAVKTSKTSKPAVKTSKPSKPPVKNIKTYCHYNMIDYTGSPALYRKFRLYRKSRLIQEVPPTPEVPPIQEVPPTPEVPPYTGSPALYRKSRPYTGSPAHLSSIILTGGVVYLLLTVSLKL